MSGPNEYMVSWDINVTSTTPEQAATEARNMVLDPDSHATIWKVEDESIPNHEGVYIDLEDEPRPYLPTQEDTDLFKAAVALAGHLWDAEGYVYDELRAAISKVQDKLRVEG